MAISSHVQPYQAIFIYFHPFPENSTNLQPCQAISKTFCHLWLCPGKSNLHGIGYCPSSLFTKGWGPCVINYFFFNRSWFKNPNGFVFASYFWKSYLKLVKQIINRVNCLYIKPKLIFFVPCPLCFKHCCDWNFFVIPSKRKNITIKINAIFSYIFSKVKFFK